MIYLGAFMEPMKRTIWRFYPPLPGLLLYYFVWSMGSCYFGTFRIHIFMFSLQAATFTLLTVIVRQPCQ